MSFQLKPEPSVESLYLDTVATMFNTHKTLYDFGYRGSFSTTTQDDGAGNVVESGRFDMVLGGAPPVDAALGDVILYRTNPLGVVKCISHDEFIANYQAV